MGNEFGVVAGTYLGGEEDLVTCLEFCEQVADDARYAYERPVRSAGALKYAAGAVLYAAMLALLLATMQLIASSRRARTSAIAG